MRRVSLFTIAVLSALALATAALAQPPDRPGPGGRDRRPPRPEAPPPPPNPLLEALDTDHDAGDLHAGDGRGSRIAEEARQGWRRQAVTRRTASADAAPAAVRRRARSRPWSCADLAMTMARDAVPVAPATMTARAVARRVMMTARAVVPGTMTMALGVARRRVMMKARGVVGVDLAMTIVRVAVLRRRMAAHVPRPSRRCCRRTFATSWI